MRGEHGEELLELFVRVFLVAFFAAAEREYYVDGVARRHELIEQLRLNLQVVRGGAARKLDALDVEVFLGDALLLPLFFLLVAELVVAHDARYGRVRERGYFDHVHVRRVGNLYSLVQGHYTEACAVFRNNQKLFSGYLPINFYVGSNTAIVTEK